MRRAAPSVAIGAAVLVVVATSLWLLPPVKALVAMLLGAAMIAIVVVDVRHFIIPDRLSLPAIPLGLLASGSLLDPQRLVLVSSDHLIGMALGGGVLWALRWAYERFRGVEGLGLGDVKLAAAAGAWVGWQGLPNVLLLAALAGLGLAAVSAIRKGGRLEAQARIPFGAFLAPALWVVWMAQISAFSGP